MLEPKLVQSRFLKRGVDRATIGRYTKFCLVGGSGVVVDVVVLYLLLGPHPSVLRLNLSKICAAECAILNNFTWNDRWTFGLPGSRQENQRGRLSRFLRFNLISTTGLVITTGLLNWQVYELRMNIYLANLISLAVVSVWNFALSSKFGWRFADRVVPDVIRM